MIQQGPVSMWSCLLGLCFLAHPSHAQVPKPDQCLVSRTYSLIRLPETKDDVSCWTGCTAEPDCHMAVVTKPLAGVSQCLLVNCLKQGSYSLPRDPSTEIKVYPKSSSDDAQRGFLRERGYGSTNERLRCFDSPIDGSCSSGGPSFFYNSTSYRCEQVSSSCRTNKNSFESRDGCEALCTEKFRCYRPRQSGGCSARFPKFFYNVTSRRCETFDFSGCGSNGNLFSTAEECERLCGDVDGAPPPSTSISAGSAIRQSAADSGLFAPVTDIDSAVLCFVALFLLVLAVVVIAVAVQRRRQSQHPPAFSDKRHLLSESDVETSPDRFK